MTAVVWSPEAEADLEDAIAYLQGRSPPAAERLVLGIFSAIELLASTRLDGPEVELVTGERVRGWPHPPYRIYYVRDSDVLRVVRIYHGSREPVTR